MSNENNVEVRVGATTGELDSAMQHGAQSVQQGADSIRNSFQGMNGPMASVRERFANLMASFKTGAAGATQAVGDHANATTQHAQRIGGALSGAVSGIQGQLGSLSSAMGFISKNFAALAAVAAGVGVFKEGIAFSKQFTGEALGLAKALNIGASEAATLNVALGDIYSSSDTVIEGTQHLARQLRNNEEALNAMGLKTRDANGEYRNMRDLLFDGVKVLGTYKEGTDRALAGQVMFGKGAADVGSLMKLNNQVLEDAAQKQKDLGMTVTVEGIEAMKGYKAAMNDVGDVMDALKKTIGDAVMPIFTKFGQWLSSAGPTAVFILKGAISGLAAAFWYVKNGVTVLWETINAMVVTVAEPIRALAAAIYKAMTGDWAGAKAEISGIGATISTAWKGAMVEIEKSSEETSKRVADLFGEGTAAKPTSNKGKKSFVDPTPEKDKKTPDERMKQWEAQLLEAKKNYMLENDMREMSLSDEAAYWNAILAKLSDGDKAKSAVRKKFAEVEFADTKRAAQQRMGIQTEVIDFEEKLALESIEKQQAASDQRTALGLQTEATQLHLEEQFENERYAIQAKAMRDRLELLSKDPMTNLVERQKVLDQLLVMEQKHANDVAKIQNRQALAAKKPYMDFNTSVQASFKQTISSMMQGTTTFAGAMQGLFKNILGAFADMVAEMVVKWAMAQVMNRVAQSTSGVAQVMSNAAVAGSAAFASIAAIPIVGPMMAPGAAAAAYAATSAFAPLASARNGYDIPAGVNPLTQLHEKEMVLPAAQADAVRNMAEGNGGGGIVNLHVHAVDAKSVQRLFRDNGRHIASALQQQNRNFALKP
jgi:hypothetical protein